MTGFLISKSSRDALGCCSSGYSKVFQIKVFLSSGPFSVHIEKFLSLNYQLPFTLELPFYLLYALKPSRTSVSHTILVLTFSNVHLFSIMPLKPPLYIGRVSWLEHGSVSSHRDVFTQFNSIN